MFGSAAVWRRGSEDAVSRANEPGRRLRHLRNASVRSELSPLAITGARGRVRATPPAAIRTSRPTPSNLAYKPPRTPDLETVLQAQRGDASAWERLVRSHCGKVYRLCHRLSRSSDRAEDLTQEAFIRAFENLHRFDPTLASFTAWLTKLAHNLVIDDYRRQRSHPTCLFADQQREGTEDVVFETPDTRHPSPLEEIERKERLALLNEALRQLPCDLREAVVLRDIQELSYQEIADILEVPDGTVKSRINRGRIELAKCVRRLLGPNYIGLQQA